MIKNSILKDYLSYCLEKLLEEKRKELNESYIIIYKVWSHLCTWLYVHEKMHEACVSKPQSVINSGQD